MDLIEKLALTKAEILEQFETAMVDALRVGLTSTVVRILAIQYYVFENNQCDA